MASYEYDSQNQELHRIAGGTLYASIPIGSYIPFGGTAIPTGWLLCNGQAVSRTDYADLFAVIGTAYGNGDGSTTFNIPDLREAVPKGAGLTSKSNNHLDADGLAVGEFLDDRLQTHQHNYVHPYQGSQFPLQSASSPANGGTELLTGDNNGRTGATTEVKSVGSNYIIKAKQIGVPADFASAIEDVIDEKFSYSTSEVNTGKKWIDGKPIYRKVVDFGALPNIAEKTVAHNLTNVDNFMLITAIAYDTSGNYLPIPYADTYQIGYSIRLMANKTNVIIQTGYDRSTYTKTYVTLEYTKTTD